MHGARWLLVGGIVIVVASVLQAAAVGDTSAMQLTEDYEPDTGVIDLKIAPDDRTVLFRADAIERLQKQLYAVPIDGSTPPRLLTGHLQEDFEVDDDYAATRDASRVVYVAGKDAQPTFDRLFLEVVPTNSGPATRLWQPPVRSGQVWWFDLIDRDRTVLFSATDTGDAADTFVATVPVAGGARTTIAEGEMGNHAVDPTETWLVRTQDADGACRILAHSLAGSDARTIADTPCGIVLIDDVSADRVVYRTGDYPNAYPDEPEYQLWSAPLDGSSEPVRLDTAAHDRSVAPPRLTASGQRVVYLDLEPGHAESIDRRATLFVVPADRSSRPRPLSEPDVATGGFVVMPDGTSVLFGRAVDDHEELAIVALSGEGLARTFASVPPGHLVSFRNVVADPDLVVYTVCDPDQPDPAGYDSTCRELAAPSTGYGPVVEVPVGETAPRHLGDGRFVNVWDVGTDPTFNVAPVDGGASPVVLWPGAEVLTGKARTDSAGQRLAFVAPDRNSVPRHLWSVGLPTFPARLQGSGRVETAATIARERFEQAEVVHVASAADFPDALATGPAAGAAGGPLLLTWRDELPEPTRVELSRLRPARIVVAGGPEAVSDDVLAQLEAFAEQVDRVGGEDRYATAAALVTGGPTDGVVYLATGQAFADALAATPAAIRDEAPMLLVRRDDLPSATSAALRRLAPREVVIVGGPSAVSESVVEAVAEVTGVSPRRVAGPDRWATARALAASFGPSLTAYLASGTAFPDGLTIGPAAGRDRLPVMLTRPGSLPDETAGALVDRGVSSVVIIGGSRAVAPAVADAVMSVLR